MTRKRPNRTGTTRVKYKISCVNTHFREKIDTFKSVPNSKSSRSILDIGNSVLS
jgi:hypothetical protein